MDLLLKNMGFQLYSWDECVVEVSPQLNLPPHIKQCRLKNNEWVLATELKNISLLKEEEVKRLFNFTRNSLKNFLSLKYILFKDQKFYFCYEKSEKNLMDYLRTEEFQLEKRLLLYKQGLEIIRAMIALQDSFGEFDHHYFFMKEIRLEKCSFPILQLLYHGKKFNNL